MPPLAFLNLLYFFIGAAESLQGGNADNQKALEHHNRISVNGKQIENILESHQNNRTEQNTEHLAGSTVDAYARQVPQNR